MIQVSLSFIVFSLSFSWGYLFQRFDVVRIHYHHMNLPTSYSLPMSGSIRFTASDDPLIPKRVTRPVLCSHSSVSSTVSLVFLPLSAHFSRWARARAGCGRTFTSYRGFVGRRGLSSVDVALGLSDYVEASRFSIVILPHCARISICHCDDSRATCLAVCCPNLDYRGLGSEHGRRVWTMTSVDQPANRASVASPSFHSSS